MNHNQFFEFLKKWREYKKYPPASGWPSEIVWGGTFWKNIKRLHEFTASNNHEYETSFFYVEGDIISTVPFKGEKEQVVSRHRLKVEFVPAKGDFYNRQIIVDGKVIKSESIKQAKIPSKINAGFLFNAHSHPVHFLPDKKTKTYGFFSAMDINSLISSGVMVSGLVTDEFWLVAKTDKVVSQIGEVGVEMLQNVSDQAYAGDKYLEDVIKNQMKDWGLVFYRTQFGHRLHRVI